MMTTKVKQIVDGITKDMQPYVIENCAIASSRIAEKHKTDALVFAVLSNLDKRVKPILASHKEAAEYHTLLQKEFLRRVGK